MCATTLSFGEAARQVEDARAEAKARQLGGDSFFVGEKLEDVGDVGIPK
jgi:hypothetical protein